MAPLSEPQVVDLYRRRARRYDLTSALYRLIGFREDRYRELAIGALGLEPGDAVVDLACGTGLNFPDFEAAVGPAGRVVGVDITDAMLAEARERVEREGWENVELVLSDVAGYEIPAGVRGVFSSYALTLSADYDAIVRRAHEALGPGGRIVILDFKRPDDWPEWAVRLFAFVGRPFGTTYDLHARHPWESVERHFPVHAMTELYGGMAYVVVGEKASA